MGQAALQYDEFEDIEPIEVPAGGIASFLTATEGSWATDDEDDLPQTGIAQVKRVADQLATYGRHEDEYMIHAAEGETVIPMEVFRKNPILKDRIFQQMRDMGIEPERYVVGNELNSLNPVTGQPEFFLKKLFKGVKKFLKTAVKVVLPVVTTIVLTPIVGPVAASAIGSGVGSLAQGGDFKDALKAAAIGAATAGVVKGVSGSAGAAKEGGNIFTGFKEGVQAGGVTGTFDEAFAAGQALGTDATTSNVSAALSAAKDVTAPVETATAASGTGYYDAGKATFDPAAGVTTTTTTPAPSTGYLGMQDLNPQLDAPASSAGTGYFDAGKATYDPAAGVTTPATPEVISSSGAPPPTTVQPKGVMDSVKQIFGIGADVDAQPIQGLKNLFLPGMDAGTQATDIAQRLADQNALPAGYTVETYAAKLAKDSLSGIGGFARKYGPAIGGVMAIDALTREEPTDFNVDEQVTGFDLREQNPYTYELGSGTMRLPSTYTIQDVSSQYTPIKAPVYQPVPLGVAQGGEIDNFPRMNGPIEGPGTETSDDIPAMLSDGEFVFTAKAVRGAGNGSRQNGMKNMYDLMSKFESMA